MREERRSGPLQRHAALQRLTAIKSPTLIIPTKVSHLMAGLIPDAQIRIYPDAAHGFPFQYPAEVAAEVNGFLVGPASDHDPARRAEQED